MCSRHSALALRSHGIEINRHTVEFSSNRRPNHSSRNFRSDRLRPGVVRSCFFLASVFFLRLCFSFLPCFALDLSRSSAFLAISCDSCLRLVSFAFRISDLSRSFLRPALPPGLRPASELPFRCGSPELYRYLFPPPNRPFAGRLAGISQARHQETTTPPTPEGATTECSDGSC
jgi:hypothetical protein